jgi:chemotaxis protein MotB
LQEALAVELGKMSNNLSVEGHTDLGPHAGKSSDSNEALSSDRTNAARRLMQESGLDDNQVSQVRGFADRRLHNL